MKLARDLERKLEAVLDGLAGRIFRGGLHPSEMAARIAREAELAQFETPSGPATANRFWITIHPDNLVETSPTGPADLGRDLTAAFADLAADRGWRLQGPVEVEVGVDPVVAPGTVRVVAAVVPGPVEPWAELRGDLHLAIGPNRALLGRAAECDLVVKHPQISRHHALIFRQGGHAYVVDLGSANGTAVDDTAVGGSPVLLEGGSRLTVAGLGFRFTPLRAAHA
jgi:hypothetical protein